MRIAWFEIVCADSKCAVRYQIRPPTIPAMRIAHESGNVRCLKCGGPVLVAMPDPLELIAAMNEAERKFGGEG
jgi:hypothetical protein